jgi:hypothetical protein
VLTADELAAILADITVGDRNKAKADGAETPEDMTFYMLHRRAVILGIFDGDLATFLDNVRVADLKRAQKQVTGADSPNPTEGDPAIA